MISHNSFGHWYVLDLSSQALPKCTYDTILSTHVSLLTQYAVVCLGHVKQWPGVIKQNVVLSIMSSWIYLKAYSMAILVLNRAKTIS